jgi:Zn finger protein HypA/HybF involved in hydrogenase expression
MMFGWIIQHIIGNIPAEFWALIAGLGAVAYFFSGFLSAVPFVQAKLTSVAVKYLGFATMLFGVFMLGSAGVTAVWKHELEAMAEKVAEAEVKSGKVNTVIKEKIVKEVKIIKENTNANNQAIEAQRDSINAECRLSDTAWMLYNQSTKNAVAPGSSRALSTSK